MIRRQAKPSSTAYLRLARAFKVRNDNIVVAITLEFIDSDEDEHHDSSQRRNATVDRPVNLPVVVPPPCMEGDASLEQLNVMLGVF